MNINLANIDFAPGQGGGGVKPSGTLEISENGIYNVYSYASASVEVLQGGWDQKSLTEGTNVIINLDNSASFVASGAFKNNKTIQTVNLPYATSVGIEAFYYCASLTQVSLPVCDYIGSNIFGWCNSLTRVSLPVCSYISNYAFQSCRTLSQVDFPVCSYIGNSAFFRCTLLLQVSIPMCSYIDNFAFLLCRALPQISLPVCTYIGERVFQSCSSLSIITIGYSSVCSLNNSNTFSHTQITSSTGSIYVPASLVDSYKSATNWSYFSTQIFPIE